MNLWHLDALKKSKNGCPQAVLKKGFNFVQCPARLAEKYIADGYRLCARYAEGKGQTFYSIEDENATTFLSKLIQTSLSGKKIFLERIESFDGIPITRTNYSFKVYACINEKIESIHEVFGIRADHIENYIFNMEIFGGVIGIPKLPEMEGLL